MSLFVAGVIFVAFAINRQWEEQWLLSKLKATVMNREMHQEFINITVIVGIAEGEVNNRTP